VIADGIRPRELFEGIDEDLSTAAERVELGGKDGTARRAKLLPFFWSEVGRRGLVLGNRALGSAVSVKNRLRLSAAGHAEILTGAPPESMEEGYSPRVTLLEMARSKAARSPTDAAAFASWQSFERIAMRKERAVVCSAGHQPIPPEWATPAMAQLEALAREMLTPWESLRPDSITVRLALEYLNRYEPKLLVVALGEMEAWADEGRYDRVVRAIGLFDGALEKLWTEAQSRPAYRDKTTLLVTVTHGHGRTGGDWNRHGPDVSGSEETWVGVLGPDTPARGEAKGAKPQFESNVAATVLELLDLSYEDLHPGADAPIEGAIRER